STPLGDAAETRVINLALGEEHARRTPISSTKGATGHTFSASIAPAAPNVCPVAPFVEERGVTGHTFGAAGAIEALFTIMALRDRVAPPTINYETPDPDCDLDYVPNVAREVPDLEVGLSNSFGFGGHNATLVFR